MNVYVVEDSPVVQERLVAMLRDIPGVVVVGVADNPPEALTAIRRLRPDVAVLDIRLRGGNGIDLLKGIRSDAPDTTTIILTSYAHPALRERCRSAGADHFFDKSSEFDRIRFVLEAHNEAPASGRLDT
ncbi:response regulator [Aromatoleum evansii]|uniref:response regulator n=1 Tax=Aromatoleum evansii TaxID=59406 RepID=UPI00145D8AEF|nr:response regulator transcription factor [Aromatoleum evansii]NMG31612.1 response regulator [Aromatoleum evansii]